MLLLLIPFSDFFQFSVSMTDMSTDQTCNLCDPVSMAMHAGCRCRGTQAEGGYTIQNHSVLCEGDNGGRGLSSLNPEALLLMSSFTETYIQCRLIQKD